MSRFTKELFVLWLICLSGCSGMDDELATQESMLLKSGEQQPLIEFYKVNINRVPEYKYRLVNSYLDVGDIKSANLYINTFSEDETDEPEYILALARLHYEKGMLSSSEMEMRKYLDNGGEQYQYHLMMGKVYARKKQFQEAISHFEESRKHGASDRDALNNIAVVRMMEGKPVEAMDILYDLYSNNPNDEKISSNLIVASIIAQRPDIAFDVLRKVRPDKEAHKQLETLMKSVGKSTLNLNELGMGNQGENPPRKTSKPSLNIDKSTPMNNNSNVIEQEIGQRNAKLSNARRIEPVRTLTPLKMPVYRVQVLATYKPIPPEFLDFLKDNYGKVYVYNHGLWKRYCVGQFNDLEQAKLFLNSLNIKGAFVVNYVQKKFIEL